MTLYFSSSFHCPDSQCLPFHSLLSTERGLSCSQVPINKAMTEHNPKRPHLQVQLAMVTGVGQYHGPGAFTGRSKSLKAKEPHLLVLEHEEPWQWTRETFELVAS